MQAPMISVPLKATNEIDWIQPLKQYIRQTYGDNPERYAEECAMLNRLRQDMRGASKDSTSGRDLLYRYYGQLELLDLRFPVDENHIKISFTWFDAFTQKPTSQYSLAYEKASIIFNISAVLSCHAAHQNRCEDSGLKTAYHSFQASAGMFTYINENFLHAPSTDLSRDTVKTLIQIMLAQAQEVFLEKQIADGKKVGLLAKLASQAGYLYSQVIESTQEHVNKTIFEKVWLLVVQIKANQLTSMSQFFQALADDDANAHGTAVSRLQIAEVTAKEASKLANSFPGTIPVNSNLASDCGINFVEITRRNLTNIQEKLWELVKDNDYIYHQPVPTEAALAIIPKLPAAKAIPVSELYAGQDIQRITGPDIFQKIVPISVTESASLYDEEKAKLLRAETERVEIANSEMVASLDYLHLPDALQVIKGSTNEEITTDENFRSWCQDIGNHDITSITFDELKSSKESITSILDKSSRQLDLEESICEKMRTTHETEWTQQPSSKLTVTLKNDIRSYREALDEASRSDSSLLAKFRQNSAYFEQMKSAYQIGETDVLFQKALIKAKGNTHIPKGMEGNLLDEDFDNDGPSVMDQVAKIEEILSKLNLIKRERSQVLKDLKEKVHNDDISQVLILNKKSISNYEAELFRAELEKFRPHQSRLLSANHKQASLMKELTSALNRLLQDKRVKAENSKHEAINRQRASVLLKYKRIYQDFLYIEAGLQSAKKWYREMKDTVGSLEKNVETFVNNRRSEGAHLITQIEQDRTKTNYSQADIDYDRLHGFMEKMSMGPVTTSGTHSHTNSISSSQRQINSVGNYQNMNPEPQSSTQTQSVQLFGSSQGSPFFFSGQTQPQLQQQTTYNPGVYPSWSPPPTHSPLLPQNLSNFNRPVHTPIQQQYLPQGFVPPPPPGPPPIMPKPAIAQTARPAILNQHSDTNQDQNEIVDQWAGLNSWK